MLSIRNSFGFASRWLLKRNAPSVCVALAHTDSTAVTVNEASDSGPILSKNHRGYSKDGALLYAGFKFYPRYILIFYCTYKICATNWTFVFRHPEFKDPPYEPSKVLMVERIRCLKKKPYWQKDVMKEIGLDGKVRAYTH